MVFKYYVTKNMTKNINTKEPKKCDGKGKIMKKLLQNSSTFFDALDFTGKKHFSASSGIFFFLASTRLLRYPSMSWSIRFSSGWKLLNYKLFWIKEICSFVRQQNENAESDEKRKRWIKLAAYDLRTH